MIQWMWFLSFLLWISLSILHITQYDILLFWMNHCFIPSSSMLLSHSSQRRQILIHTSISRFFSLSILKHVHLISFTRTIFLQDCYVFVNLYAMWRSFHSIDHSYSYTVCWWGFCSLECVWGRYSENCSISLLPCPWEVPCTHNSNCPSSDIQEGCESCSWWD